MRLNPNYAGSTIGSNDEISWLWVHPRTCGEDRSYENTSLFKEGSPPHMRGIRCARVVEVPGRGFTPAHAGNTHSAGVHEGMTKVHPRTCGEYAT